MQVEPKKPANLYPQPNLRPVFKAKQPQTTAQGKGQQQQEGEEGDQAQPHAKRTKLVLDEVEGHQEISKQQAGDEGIGGTRQGTAEADGGLAGLLGGYGSESDSDS